jgi:transketolase
VKALCDEVRELVVELSLRATTCHVASALSMVEIMVALNHRVARDGDRVLLSKGHAASGFFAAQAVAGVIARHELLDEYCQDGGRWGGHPEKGLPGVEMSGGSLGHGPSLALGIALGDPEHRVFCVVGDGELNEGSVWEAIQLAGHLRTGNLVMVVDANGHQGLGPVGRVLALDPLAAKLEAFGWEAREVGGHDLDALAAALDEPADRPICVIARTVKGKGVDFLEDDWKAHYRSLKPHERELAYAALERGRA